MTSFDEISALKQRLAVIEQEISKLEGMVHDVDKNNTGRVTDTSAGGHDSDDDDMYSEDSPWAGYLSKLFSKLDEFSRDRLNCERLLRKQGVHVPLRDED